MMDKQKRVGQLAGLTLASSGMDGPRHGRRFKIGLGFLSGSQTLLFSVESLGQRVTE